jgi:electron transport complex protein RnfE
MAAAVDSISKRSDEMTATLAPELAPVAPPTNEPEFIPGAPPPATVWADTWRGISAENPVLVQMLGMCPTMAVTNVLANGIAMGLATTFVLVGSGLFVSLLKKYIAHEVRITSYILIIATFVTLADLLLAASFPEISKALGPFIPLIVANCLLLGRAEAFAAKVGPVRAVADGMGMGIGFTLSLSAMSAIRELLGRGTLLGFDILGPRWEPWVFMVLPPGGFFTLGLLLITAAWIDQKRRNRRMAEAK